MRIARAKSRHSPVDTAAIAMAVGALVIGVMAVANYAVARRTERKHPPRGRFIEVDGVRLHVLERGSGPAVVLLHGNGAMAEDFLISGVFGGLAVEHRVIAFDRPGFGHSERPGDRVWSAAAQAALLLKALDRMGVEKPIILGHSWGTMVALEMALARPRGVAGLVLVSGYYIPTPRLDVPLMSVPAMPILGDIMRYTISPLLGWLLAPVVFRKLFAPAQVTAAFRRRFPTSMALRPWQLRATAADTALMIPGAAELAKRYEELDVPVTVLGAPGDRIVDTETQAMGLDRRLRESELRLVEGAGHMLHHTDPGRVVAAVAELVTSGGGGGGSSAPAHA